MTAPYSIDQLRNALGAGRSFEAGMSYYRQGRVDSINVERNGEGPFRLEGAVNGSHYQPYTQDVEITPLRGGGLRIEGQCSCPVGWNCKHVTAAVVAWQGSWVDPFQTPPELETWLVKLKSMVEREGEADLAQSRSSVIYLLDVKGGQAFIKPLSIKLGKQGAIQGSPSQLNMDSVASGTPPKYLRASDLKILRAIARAQRYPARDYELRGAEGAAALVELAATGRCRWRSLLGPIVTLGPALPATGGWKADKDDKQRFTLTLAAAGDAEIIKVTPPHYFDPQSLQLGPVTTDLAPSILGALLEAPAVPPAVADEVAERLSAIFHTATLPNPPPLPRPVGGYETLRLTPRPIARLTMGSVAKNIYPDGKHVYWSGRVPQAMPVIQVSFDYAGNLFQLSDPAKTGRGTVDGRTVRLARDSKAEGRHVSRLGKLGLNRLSALREVYPIADQQAWLGLNGDGRASNFADFLRLSRPILEAEGWQVDVDADFPLKLIEAEEGDWTFELTEAGTDPGGVDWFDLRLEVGADGGRLDIVPALIALLRGLPHGTDLSAWLKQRQAGGRIDLALTEDQLISLPLEKVAPILEGLIAVWGPHGLNAGETRVSRYETPGLLEMQGRVEGSVVWRGKDRLAGLIEELGAWTTREPTPLPRDFGADLRPYQQTGLDWLQMLSRTGFGGVLADDMGLGKTVQTLAHLVVEKAAGRLSAPALVVAPTSVLPNWMAEAQRFAPSLKVLMLRGPARAGDFPLIDQSDLVITSYPLLVRDKDEHTPRSYSMVILDEGQTIRNPTTAAAQAAFALDAKQKIVLSGTPVENHLGDIWSLMRFLNPGLLGDVKSFARTYRSPIEKQGDRTARAQLSHRLKAFLLRRSKSEVANDLPARTEIAEAIELNSTQSNLYEATRLIMYDRVRKALDDKGLARSSIVVLDALLKLRQVCCDPRLMKTASATAKAGGSAKLDRLMELIEQLKLEGRKALVFSQFTSMLTLIRDELNERGYSHAWLTGDTTDRAAPVAMFQSGKTDLFLISLKAGGTGLNLTEADTVILYDPWWNPAVEAQAIDRAHRIGQRKPVFVHRLITAGTVEEKMLELQSRKRDLAAALWDEDAAAMGALSEADIRDLFAGP